MRKAQQWLQALFKAEGFRGPVLTLLSGTTLATGISYLGEPLLMLIYTPAEFDVFALFTSFVALLLPIGSLRYEDALMVPKKDEDALPVLGLAFLVMVGVTAGAMLLFVVAGSALTTALQTEALQPWLLWVPIVFLVIRIAKLLELWMTRQNRFRWVSGALTARSGALVSSKVTLGLPPISLGANGLVWGYVAGHFLHALALLGGLRQSSWSMLTRCFDRKAITQAAYRFRHFPLFGAPAALLNALQMYLPLLAIGFLIAENGIVGSFGQALKATLPLTILGRLIAQVFFVRAAEAAHANTLTTLTTTVHKRLVMLALFPALALIIAGPRLFVLIGPEWETAGRFVQYLAPWMLLAAIASPLTRIFDVLEQQRIDLLVSIGMFGLLLVALLLGWFKPDPAVLIPAIAASGFVGRILHIRVMTKLVDIPMRTIASHYASYLLLSAPFLALLYLATLISNIWLFLLLCLVSGVGFYGYITWKEDLLGLRHRA